VCLSVFAFFFFFFFFRAFERRPHNAAPIPLSPWMLRVSMTDHNNVSFDGKWFRSKPKHKQTKERKEALSFVCLFSPSPPIFF